MKKEIAALFFYMLYMVAMMRPVMPILEYYANYEYVATVLCENRDKPAMACNGKCYLEKELIKVAASPKTQKQQHHSSIPQIDFTKYPVSPIQNTQYGFVKENYKVSENWFYLIGKPRQIITSIYRPPLSV